MSDDVKRMVAVTGMAILFVGAWALAASSGYVEFTHFAKVLNFLWITTGLWIFEVIITGIKDPSYSFADHGFQLTVISVISLVTLGATTYLDRYANARLFSALIAALTLMSFVLYVYVSKKQQGVSLTWPWRLATLIAGVVSAEIYIYVSISEEVTAWHWFF